MATEKVEIRTASLRDLPSIMEIEKHSYPIDMQADEEKMAQRLEVFPDGNFVVLKHGKPVGYATNQIVHFNPSDSPKNWIKCTNGGYSGITHEADGNALYFISTGVHYSHRRTGIGRVIYSRRLELAGELGLDFAFANFRIQTLRDNLGKVLGITERDYIKLEDEEIKKLGKEYLEKVKRQEVKDPLRIMFDNGFVLKDIVPWYMQDIDSMHTGAYMYKSLG